MRRRCKQGALSDISKAISLDSENASNYIARGQIELSLNKKNVALQDFKKSITMFDKEILKNPNSAEAYIGRAKTNYSCGETEKMCPDLKKASRFGVKQAEELIKQFCK